MFHCIKTHKSCLVSVVNYMDKYLAYCSPNSLPGCHGYNENPALSRSLRCFSTTHGILRRGKNKNQNKSNEAINREKKTMGREYPKRYNNHIIIQIRYGKTKLGLRPPRGNCSRKPRYRNALVGGSASLAQLPAICSLPRSLACMHFNDGNIFLSQFVYFTPV